MPGTTPATSVTVPQELFLLRLGRAHISSHPPGAHGVEYFCIQVKQQDAGSWPQGGQEPLPYFGSPSRSLDPE